MKPRQHNRRLRTLRRVIPAIVMAITISACSSSDDDSGSDTMDGNDVTDGTDTTNPDDQSRITAVFSSQAGFTSGQVQRLSISDGDVLDGAYEATSSDIAVATDGTSVYQLGRFLLDSVTKYSLDDVNTPIYQRSVAGSDESANPYEIVFVSDTKAYLIRYDSPAVWIVNPSAGTDELFKIGELDLSAYDTNDATPEPNGAVIIDDRLYISMERLDRVNFAPSFQPVQSGYIAVFDTTTDQEIDTGMGTADSLLGIPVNVENPAPLQYSQADEMIYVLGRGKYFSVDDSNGDRYTGGLVRVDPETFTTELVLDDGTETDNQNFLFNLLPVSASKAYILTYASFGVVTMRELNLLTGELAEGDIASLSNVDVTVMALGPNNRVWIGLGGEEPGFMLLDPADNSILKPLIQTTLKPNDIVFIVE